MYTISLAYPNLSNGDEVQFTGLPYTFKNGKTYELTDADAEAFRAASPVVSTSEDGFVSYGPGPTLEEAFKDNEYVTIKKGGDA
jgi:hypothetical protein